MIFVKFFETVQKSGGVIKQLGIELDTFMNQEFDPDDNHIAIDTTSIMDPVAIQSLTSSGINLKSGRDIKFSIEYDGWNQILHVSAGYSENPLVTILNHSISMFGSTVPSFVYVGFTASTGLCLRVTKSGIGFSPPLSCQILVLVGMTKCIRERPGTFGLLMCLFFYVCWF